MSLCGGAPAEVEPNGRSKSGVATTKVRKSVLTNKKKKFRRVGDPAKRGQRARRIQLFKSKRSRRVSASEHSADVSSKS